MSHRDAHSPTCWITYDQQLEKEKQIYFKIRREEETKLNETK